MFYVTEQGEIIFLEGEPWWEWESVAKAAEAVPANASCDAGIREMAFHAGEPQVEVASIANPRHEARISTAVFTMMLYGAVLLPHKMSLACRFFASFVSKCIFLVLRRALGETPPRNESLAAWVDSPGPPSAPSPILCQIGAACKA